MIDWRNVVVFTRYFQFLLYLVSFDRSCLRDIYGKLAQLLYGVSICRTLIYTIMKPSESLSSRASRLPKPTHMRTGTSIVLTIVLNHLSPSFTLQRYPTYLLLRAL